MLENRAKLMFRVERATPRTVRGPQCMESGVVCFTMLRVGQGWVRAVCIRWASPRITGSRYPGLHRFSEHRLTRYSRLIQMRRIQKSPGDHIAPPLNMLLNVLCLLFIFCTSHFSACAKDPGSEPPRNPSENPSRSIYKRSDTELRKASRLQELNLDAAHIILPKDHGTSSTDTSHRS